MDVIVMDSPVFKQMQSMFENSCQMVEQLTKELKKKEFELWTPAEVAEYTKYDVKTILRKKEEIGFSTLGKDIRFKPEDVRAYFEKHSIKPRKRLA